MSSKELGQRLVLSSMARKQLITVHCVVPQGVDLSIKQGNAFSHDVMYARTS